MSGTAPPKNTFVKTFNTLYKEMNELRDRPMTYDEIATRYRISKAMAWLIINKKYEPKTGVIRARLGLPQQIVVTVVRDRKGRFAGHE